MHGFTRELREDREQVPGGVSCRRREAGLRPVYTGIPCRLRDCRNCQKCSSVGELHGYTRESRLDREQVLGASPVAEEKRLRPVYTRIPFNLPNNFVGLKGLNDFLSQISYVNGSYFYKGLMEANFNTKPLQCLLRDEFFYPLTSISNFS